MPAQVIRSTTQDHLEIEDILEDIILLKNGSANLVVETNAINFGLLSEEEQDATIYAYAALLNSLTFTIQILIRSEVKDVSGYLQLLEEQSVKQLNPVKKNHIESYKNFIRSLVTERNVLEKRFYIVIPFSTLELGVSQSVTSSFSTKKTLPFDKSYLLEKAKTNLEPKRDHLYRQLGRLGLAARQLTTQELIQLVFSMYNPGSTQGNRIGSASDYKTPLVQPAYINSQEVIMSDNSNNPNPTQPPTPQPASTPPSLDPVTPPSPQTPPSPTPSPVPDSTAQTPTPENPSLTQPTPPPPAPPSPNPTTPTPPSFTPPPPTPAPQAPTGSTPTEDQTPPSPASPTPPAAEPSLSPSPEPPTSEAQDLIDSAANDLTKTQPASPTDSTE